MQPDEASTLRREGIKVTMTRPVGGVRRRWVFVGNMLGMMACLLSMAAGTLFGLFYWGSNAFADLWNRHKWDIVRDTLLHRDPMLTWTPERQFPDRTSLNVLVLGVDHDYDNKAQIIRTSPGRSDSILVARVDFVQKKIAALTIPRDTAVHIPGRRGIHKINAAHAFGGPELTIETIETVFGIPIDAYVVLNFEGFQKIVDAIGGVYINVEKQLDYDDNWGKLHIHLKPGYQHLNGYQAMGYVRMRHSDSDYMRSKRQHQFLEALRTKLKNPATFSVLPRVVDTLADSLKHGFMTRDQMFTLANFARLLKKEDIIIETLPSFEGPSYVTIDPEKSAEVIQRLFFPNQYLARTIDAPDPNTVRAMNSRYERGGRRRSHRTTRVRAKSEKPAGEATTVIESQEAPPTEEPGASLSVDPKPGESRPSEPGLHTPSEDSSGGAG